MAERRLAAILAADVVGYSRLMGADEEATLARVQATFAQAAPLVAARGGRIFKTMGDAFLAEFPSAVGAVHCAAEVQAALAADAEGLRLRMGVHLGDVMPQGDDLFGDGVNIAARVEGVAQPGGVALSADVANAVRGKLPFALVDQGEKTLKNIERPMRVFYLSAPGGAPGGGPGAAGAGPGRGTGRWRWVAAVLLVLGAAGAGWWAWRPVAVDAPVATVAPAAQPGVPRLSFVVLPFANRSGDAEQDYFVDGLTDSLTTDLSRLDGSFVISRGSAFTYKGRAVDARQVGRELGVRYVVEGSVLRSGERVRVAAQLVEAESGRTLWSDSFDGNRGDMLEMVDQATGRIGGAVGGRAIEQESRRTASSSNPDAADLTLRGWAALNRGVTRENAQEAEGVFRAAQALEPADASAAVGMARVLSARLSQNWGGDRATLAEAVEQQLALAFRRDPDNALGLATFCSIRHQRGRVAEAIAACRRAIAVNPNLLVAYANLSTAYGYNNQADEALAMADRALRLSPRDALLYQLHHVRGLALFTLGRHAEALAAFEESLRLNPDAQQSRMLRSAILANQGRQSEAAAALRDYMSTAPQTTVAAVQRYLWTLSDNPAWRQSREYLFEGLRRAGMPEG